MRLLLVWRGNRANFGPISIPLERDKDMIHFCIDVDFATAVRVLIIILLVI